MVDEQNKLEIPPTYMSKMYFDEVYFARSAENYVNHQIPHERTHPPLGKLIEATGVAVFGETPFGWRIMGVVFATLMVPLMYLLGKKLFGSWIGGFSAAFLLSFRLYALYDGTHRYSRHLRRVFLVGFATVLLNLLHERC